MGVVEAVAVAVDTSEAVGRVVSVGVWVGLFDGVAGWEVVDSGEPVVAAGVEVGDCCVADSCVGVDVVGCWVVESGVLVGAGVVGWGFAGVVGVVAACPLSLGVGFCCPLLVFGVVSVGVLGWVEESWVGRSSDELVGLGVEVSPVGGVFVGLFEGEVSPVDGVSVGALLFGVDGDSPVWGVAVGVSLFGFDGVVSPVGGVGLDPLPFGLDGVVSPGEGDPLDEGAVCPASVDPLLFGLDGVESPVGGVSFAPLPFGLEGVDSSGAELLGEPFCGVAPSSVGAVDAGFVDPPVSPLLGVAGAFGPVLSDAFGL
ncbi:hypothetical protein ACFWF3_00425 [Nocardia sp. NPDC060220]|uniref:hypothetical protein n=1 Tax=Nocardia sp. NPDC060220 TaxID=3347076 RepID=UPI003668460A